MDKDFIWTDDVDCAITVCDKEGKVLFQNKVSRGLFQRDGETMVGKRLMPCHSDHSRGLIGEMLATGNTHCYTITKKGRKKLVYQTPWRGSRTGRDFVLSARDDGTLRPRQG